MRSRGATPVLVAVVLAACSGGSGDAAADDASDLNALVASYDLASGEAQRFVVGIVTNEQQLVSFGSARLRFSYLGDGDDSDEAVPGPAAMATWQPIAGQDLGAVPAQATVVDAVDGNGVYAARGVSFDRPGFWQVDVSIEVDGEARRAEAAFQVHPEHQIAAVGDAAPRTRNDLPGVAGVPPKSIDSRAADDRPVPDPELHRTANADAIASGRPTMVVVSTPVYCVSRFCGPVTDEVGQLAREFGDRMSFVHLEVWRDFETTELNDSAAEWIYPPGVDEATEPWVWVVDGAGTIVARFDNVASDVELADAVREALA